jgi:Fe-S-cluster containining protein
MFAGQIHYLPEEFKHIMPETVKHPLFNQYFNFRERFTKIEKGKKKYFVPIKEDFITLLVSEQNFNKSKEMGIDMQTGNLKECIFLAWDSDGFPTCVIHEFKPHMCAVYPEVKGGACLNHKERYYSRRFFEFQQQSIGIVIRVLKELYGAKVQDQRAFDILTLLMDYGKFLKEKTQEFFSREFGINNHEFDAMVNNLFEIHLLMQYPSQEGDLIEGISHLEVEREIEQIMKEQRWDSKKSYINQ